MAKKRDDTQRSNASASSSIEEVEDIPPFDDEQVEEGSVEGVAPVSTVEQEEGNGNAASASHNSGLTTEESSSSYSEYEEDLFPDQESPRKGAPPEATPAEQESDEEGSNPNLFQNSFSGNSFHSSNSGLAKSHHSVEVSVAVWRRTWEDRVKQFQKEHPQEYADLERQMKQKDIRHIERERSQRIYENKIFQNVDRVFKILGGAGCALCMCTILIIIILGAILKKDVDVEPLPHEITQAPTVFGTSAPSLSPIQDDTNANANTTDTVEERLRVLFRY